MEEYIDDDLEDDSKDEKRIERAERAVERRVIKKRKAEKRTGGWAAAVAGPQTAMLRGPHGVLGERRPSLTGDEMPPAIPVFPPVFLPGSLA